MDDQVASASEVSSLNNVRDINDGSGNSVNISVGIVDGAILDEHNLVSTNQYSSTAVATSGMSYGEESAAAVVPEKLIASLYKRTANNTKRKEHIIWDHFDVDHELCRARCLNCNSTISATSYVMKRHFQYKHPVVYKTIEEEEGRIKFLLETNPDVLHALSTNENSQLQQSHNDDYQHIKEESSQQLISQEDERNNHHYQHAEGIAGSQDQSSGHTSFQTLPNHQSQQIASSAGFVMNDATGSFEQPSATRTYQQSHTSSMSYSSHNKRRKSTISGGSWAANGVSKGSAADRESASSIAESIRRSRMYINELSDEDLYGGIVARTLRRLSPRKRLLARREIDALLFKFEFDDESLSK